MKSRIAKTVLFLTAFTVLSVTAENVIKFNNHGNVYATFGNGYSSLTDALSLGIWVRGVRHNHTYNSHRVFIAGVNGRFELSLTSAWPDQGKLQFLTECGTAVETTQHINDDRWHFIMGTFDVAGGAQRLYVDGECVAELTTGIVPLAEATRSFSIKGACRGNTWNMENPYEDQNYFYGSLAELSVWNKALSSSEVTALAHASARLNGDEAGLETYWSLHLQKRFNSVSYSIPSSNISGTARTLTITSSSAPVVDDPDFPLGPYARCIATPEWCAANGVTPSVTPTGRSFQDPFTNANAAVALGKTNEKMLFAPGVHKINATLRLRGDYLWVASYDPATGKPDAEHTILDGQGARRHMHFAINTDDAAHTEIDSLTFTNGYEANGAAIYVYGQNKEVKVYNCIFTGNHSTGGWIGGTFAYHAPNPEPVVSNCVFRGNVADAKGGAMTCSGGSATIVDCLFTNNCVTATGTSGEGGAVGNAEKATGVKFTRCTFVDSEAGYGGMVHYYKDWQFTDCIFTGGCGAQYGGVAYCGEGGSGTTFTRCKFTGLKKLTRNTSYGYLHPRDNESYIDCEFTDNTGTADCFFFEWAGNALVRQCLFARNSFGSIANEFTSSRPNRFENCTFADAGTFTKRNGSAQYGTNVVVNCMMPLMDPGDVGKVITVVTNSVIKAGTLSTENQNLYLAPSARAKSYFKDPENGDYSLRDGSRYRDKGIVLDWMTADALDHAGHPRLTDALGVADASALPDLGAFECQVPIPPVPGVLLFIR